MRPRLSNEVHQLYKLRSAAHCNGNGPWRRPAPETTVNIAIAPLVSKEGARIGRLIIFDDVTDRADLERRLVQADKLSSIGLLAAGVAHEVNTPLAVISTYAQMLAKQVSGRRAEIEAARQDRQADLPRQRDRQLAAELLAHLVHRVRRSRSEQSDPGDALAARAPVREDRHPRRRRTSPRQLPADPRQRRQAPAGLPEPVPERPRRHGRAAARRCLPSSAATAAQASSSRFATPAPASPREHLSRIYDPFFTTKGVAEGHRTRTSVTYGIVEEHGGMIEADSAAGPGRHASGWSSPLVRKPVNA